MSRQSYLQDVVVAGLRALGFDEQADESIHFSYEMVALSPRCCAELGIELSEEDARRPYIEVSGRKGLGVKADDLMDKLMETALGEVASRHPEDNEAAQLAIATEIAMGALRYFLLKFTRNTVIAFDFQEALSFEGETGPYVQYAAVRARNIFRKLEERGEAMPDFSAALTREAMARQLAHENCWQILLAASQSGFGGGARGGRGRAGACGEVRLSAGADVQHLLSSVSRCWRSRIAERKAFLLWMTEYLAPSNWSARWRCWGSRFRRTCSQSICCSHSTPATRTSRSGSSMARAGGSPASAHRPRADVGRVGHSAAESAALRGARSGGDPRHHRFVRGASAELRAGGNVAAVISGRRRCS